MNKLNSVTDALPVLLVVDDESAIQKILTHYFKSKFTVVTCSDGREALSWLYSGNFPDIIIADVNMPVLNGMDFLQELRQSVLYGSVPLLFLSGNDSSDTKISCLEAGADDFIVKPFNPRELQARIFSILKRTSLVKA